MNAFALYIDSLCYQMATGINGRGGQERLAELLGVNPSVIGQWRKGQDIRLSSLSSALEKLGGDISRSLPNYNPKPLHQTRRNVPFLPHFTAKVCQKRDCLKMPETTRIQVMLLTLAS